MSVMRRMIDDLTPLNRAFCSPDYDETVEYLLSLLPFRVIKYTQADATNGWVIPPRWELKESKIIKNGELIWNGLCHPLATIALSTSFRGKVSLKELKQHMHYDQRYPDAIPFHFRQLYRPWSRDWGFCVSKELYDSLRDDGDYEVVIETEEAEGHLKVLEYDHKGNHPVTFVFVAHLDHPGMANDNLSGCAVGVELFRRLRSRTTNFSYKLLLVPEIIGSELYCSNNRDPIWPPILEGLFLACLGSKTRLSLDKSVNGNTALEWALVKALVELNCEVRLRDFMDVAHDDDIVWQSHGVSMCRLTRFPYAEYHTHMDDSTIISDTQLQATVGILEKAIYILESSHLIINRMQGYPCLSNPEFDLYIDPGQSAFNRVENSTKLKLRKVMELLSCLDKPVLLEMLAQRIGIEAKDLIDYVSKWQDKGLLQLLPLDRDLCNVSALCDE